MLVKILKEEHTSYLAILRICFLHPSYLEEGWSLEFARQSDGSDVDQRWCKFALWLHHTHAHIVGGEVHVTLGAGSMESFHVGAFLLHSATAYPFSNPVHRYTEAFQGTTRKSLTIIDHP